MNAKDLIEYGQQNDFLINFGDHGRTGLEWELGKGDNIFIPDWDRGGTTTGEGQGGDFPEPEPEPEKKSNKLLLLAAAIIGIYNAIG